jgi:hypothetical protein
MIEVQLELNIDSFLIHSSAVASDPSGQLPAKAMRFSCRKVASVRLLTDSTPTTDFEFLGSNSKRDTKIESDRGFDEQLLQYLTTHSTVDISNVNVTYGSSGFSTTPKSESSGEIGRLFLTKLPNQSSLVLELVTKPDEFEAMWKLMTRQNIQQVIATLVCFKLKHAKPGEHGEMILVAGVLSSSLRLMPN